MPFQCSQSAMSHFLLFAGKNLAINVEHNHRHTNEPMFANLGAGSLKKCRRNQSAIRPLVQLTAATPTTAPSKKNRWKICKNCNVCQQQGCSRCVSISTATFPFPLTEPHPRDSFTGAGCRTCHLSAGIWEASRAKTKSKDWICHRKYGRSKNRVRDVRGGETHQNLTRDTIVSLKFKLICMPLLWVVRFSSECFLY